jgi:hypothetical protein
MLRAALLDDGGVHFVDVARGALLYCIEAAVKGSRVRSFSTDARGNMLAAACNDGAVRPLPPAAPGCRTWLLLLAAAHGCPSACSKPAVCAAKPCCRTQRPAPQVRVFDLAAVRQHAAAPLPLKLITPEQLLTHPVPANENDPAAANQAQRAPQAAAAAAAGPGPEEEAAAGWAPSTGISMPSARPRPAAAGAARGLAVRPSVQKSQVAFNRKQLRLLLQQHGEYPAEYRLLIW